MTPARSLHPNLPSLVSDQRTLELQALVDRDGLTIIQAAEHLDGVGSHSIDKVNPRNGGRHRDPYALRMIEKRRAHHG